MNSKSVLGLIAVVVIVFFGIWYFSSSTLPAPVVVNDGASGGAAGTEGERPVTSTTSTTTSGSSPVNQVTVTYTQSGFSPADVTIPIGSTVTFVNDGGPNMWVASDPHPAHTGYSGTDRNTHCPGGSMTSFDQCAPGATFSFTFDKAGTWRFHNHMKAADKGSIVVQ